MKLCAAEEYGIRCLLQVAQAPGSFLTIHEIARREDLSAPYVAKLMRVLLKGGFVRSIRGLKGGYELTQPPQRISVASILNVLGKRIFVPDFCECYTGIARACRHKVHCSLRQLWMAIDNMVQSALTRTMLSDLLCTESEMESWVRQHIMARIAGIELPAHEGHA
ncbi:MAG: Rrf2 family transcriptional regulator [Deltaproteobacteria bacterium]|nr:Rrf2 family transcriptional regulator [Deltaproteobacteria bacterium]